MKKFLSLLLALTLVLSLVVVPARAATTPGQITGNISIKNGQNTAESPIQLKKDDNEKKTITLTADTASLKLTNSEGSEQTGATKVFTWSTSSDVVKISYTNESCTVTADKTGTATVTCSVKMSKPDGDNTVEATKTATVTINSSDPDGDANTAFGNAITLTYDNRPCTLSKGVYTGYQFGDTAGQWKATVPENSGFTVTDGDNLTVSNNTVTVNGKRTKGDKTVTVTFGVKVEPATVTVTPASSTILSGGNVLLTADAKGFTNAKYAWYEAKGSGEFEPVKGATSSTLGVELTNNTKENVTYTYKCKVTNGAEGAPSVTSDPAVTVTVQPAGEYDLFVNVVKPENTSGNSIMLTPASSKAEFSTELKVKADNEYNSVEDATYRYDVTGNESAFNITGKDSSTLNVTLKSGRSGTITVTPTATYMGKRFSAKSYTISSNTLSATLPTSVENGSSITLYTKSSDRHEDANLALVAQKVLRDNVSEDLRVTEATIKEARSTTTSVTGGTISKLNSSKGTYTFTADKSSLTPAKMTIVATAGGSQYEIKLTIPVTPIMGTNFESVTAEPVSSTATTTSYRVYFPTTYTNYYVVNTSGSTPGSWSDSMVSGKGYNYNTPYPLSASNFNNANGTCTLYVIAKDGVNGNYYGGQMTVSLTNYDIKYSVVAGKDVTFSQKDFDSFVKEYAKNRGDWTTASRKDYPYVEFDHAELSTIPTAKTEGTLYYKGSEVTASSNRKAEYADLDRMTFEAASKPTRDTVTLRFSLVCKKYSSASDKGSTVTYPINVVISIVKEDITYTVGIDDSVSVKVSDFVNFLQDAKTSYRKSTLDYVKFDVSGKNVSSYAYGGLYRSYSSYSTGKLADSTDKFYYEPSRTQYDLADVAYHTTRWAEAGKTVYIPFTVYGTKGEEASGTMAITIAQTMNFIDVKASDFFYEPVKWAVNNKITNGTSSTTFSPYKNCNRAEIVTFLWRAAGSPEPTVTRNPFKDVNAVTHSSYYKAILWASQKGITAGTTATTFSPYQECTRSQIVTFLYRYAGKPSGYYTNPFKDVSSVNEASYYNAILWAVGKGITQGTSTTTFSPYASCTRGEAVTFLYRYVNGVK